MIIDSIPFLIAIGFIAFFLINDQIRKGSIKKTRAHLSETFFTDLPPYTTFKAIMTFANQKRYQIDDFDERHFAVILNERMTWNSYGSLYPIYVNQQDGRTMVEVGITSKLGKVSLFSPFNKRVLTLRLERMLNAIKSAVFAYEEKTYEKLRGES
jgi:hypothetical protein